MREVVGLYLNPPGRALILCVGEKSRFMREIAHSVMRWRGGTMILMWIAKRVEAKRNFRKVVGYRALPKLEAMLRANDAVIYRERRVDNG